jgi:hypothetical protein
MNGARQTRHPERSAFGAQSKDPVALQINMEQFPPSGKDAIALR